MLKEQEMVKDAFEYLLGICDGAKRREGHGFNEFDSFFAHYLHTLHYEAWTFKQWEAILRKMRKYKGQLGSANLELPSYIPIPKPANAVRKLSLDLTNDRIVLKSDFDQRIVDAVRIVIGRQWDGATKTWNFPIEMTEPLLNQLERFNFEIEPAIKSYYNYLSDKKGKEGTVYFEGVRAFIHDYGLNPQQNNSTLLFLSIIGYKTSLKSIFSALVNVKSVNCNLGDESGFGQEKILYPYYEYQSLSKQLPSGLSHVFIYPKKANFNNLDGEHSDFILFFKEDDDEKLIKNTFYLYLDKATTIPLHANWKDYLWTIGMDNGWITKLKTRRMNAYLVNPSEKELIEEIRHALKEKIICV